MSDFLAGLLLTIFAFATILGMIIGGLGMFVIFTSLGTLSWLILLIALVFIINLL